VAANSELRITPDFIETRDSSGAGYSTRDTRFALGHDLHHGVPPVRKRSVRGAPSALTSARTSMPGPQLLERTQSARALPDLGFSDAQAGKQAGQRLARWLSALRARRTAGAGSILLGADRQRFDQGGGSSGSSEGLGAIVANATTPEAARATIAALPTSAP